MTIIAMTDLDLANKRVLIREDLNVPISDGEVTSDARIRAALPTIKQAVAQGAEVILMSHLGRPTEGEFDPKYSLEPVAIRLSELLEQTVRVEREWSEGLEVGSGEVVLIENVRFNRGEKANDDDLARQYAKLCDIFVMDAFGTAHRAQASTHGVAQHAPIACAGPLLMGELSALKKALANPARPLVAIVGGSKVSTKLTVLETLSDKVDQLIVGGGIANTFIAASGHDVGASLCETGLVSNAKALMEKTSIPIPSDVVTASKDHNATSMDYLKTAKAEVKPANAIAEDDMVLDIGPESAQALAKQLKAAKTIIWNGPVGVFEIDQFGEGTKIIANAIAESEAFSIAGGGDTLAAIDKYQVTDQISYISTGGGAFLEYVEGKTLPAVAILEQRGQA